MAKQIQTTAYIYESSGIPCKNKVSWQIRVALKDLSATARAGLPSNQLQWHCQFGAVLSGHDGEQQDRKGRPRTMATLTPEEKEANALHPDLLLVEKVKAGDLSAFEQLMRQYDRQIFRIALHITQNREDAEDIVQDTFFKAFQKMNQFQGNSKFYTWLVRIAVNESLMRLRKRRSQKRFPWTMKSRRRKVPFHATSRTGCQIQSRTTTRSELADILRKTIKGLPPGFRTVFALRDIDGLSTEETAQALGLSVPAVKSRLLRARLQLRERLSRYFRVPTGEHAP